LDRLRHCISAEAESFAACSARTAHRSIRRLSFLQTKGFAMGWLRPALAAFFGLVIASVAGLFVLPIFAFIDPVTSEAIYSLLDVLHELLDETDVDASAAEEAEALLKFFYTAILAIGFFPIVLVAGVGALAKLRSWTYFAAATGMVTAAMPLVLRSAYDLPRSGPSATLDMRIALVLFLTGLVVGSVFWFVSGAFAGPREKAKP
jgi:nitrate reductase NapE component